MYYVRVKLIISDFRNTISYDIYIPNYIHTSDFENLPLKKSPF